MHYQPRQAQYIENHDGWELELRCFRDEARFRSERRPILMIPGYAMNTFILSFHPTSQSLVEFLCEDGFEVWTANLRGQGGSIPKRRGLREKIGLQALSLVDIPCVMAWVRTHTRSACAEIDVVGCSLGASMLYGYLAHHRKGHGIGAMVSIGGPLRWERVHPLMRLAFASPTIAGLVPIRGTRRLARAILPVVQRFPALLSIYMNANICNLTRGDQLVNTVDDPIPHINRQIARWMAKKDLVIEGVQVTEALRGLALPVLCILANADGIVPPETALSIQKVLGPKYVEVLEAGDEEYWFAHADLFISELAAQRVFAPMRDWLLRQQ